MGEPDRLEMTQILCNLKQASGEKSDSTNRIFEAVFQELRRLAGDLMRRERVDHTLQSTALVNEAYLRLVDGTRIEWQNRAHFFGIAARAMRQILVDHARKRMASKRGGDLQRITFDDGVCLPDTHDVEILDLERALTRLSEMDERLGKVIELRVFAGMKAEEVAHVLGVSRRTVQGDWRVAKMWLARELSAESTATDDPPSDGSG